MKRLFAQHEWLKTLAQYAGAALLSLFLLALVLKLGRADLRIPLQYSGDALLHSMFIKGTLDNGWYWQNRFVGAPKGLKMYDYPAVDNFHFFIIFLISRFTSNTALILNLFFLLTFPLVAISSLFTLRHLNFSFFPSLGASLLYSFLPYHFMRGENHIFLAAYELIPLSILVLVWICTDKFLWAAGGKWNLRDLALTASLVLAVAMGLNGVYYPFFWCFLLLIAGAFTSLSRKRIRPLILAGIFIVVTATTFLLNSLPSLIYIYRHGDVNATQRYAGEAEAFGLKISQLLLPITAHRIPFLATLKRDYNEAPLVNENDTASLGAIGSVGFLLLLAQLFKRKTSNAESTSTDALLNPLSVLNIWAVLLATIGGFASLFALLISPHIRSYNRISLFIAFFSLITVTVWLERLSSAAAARKARVPFYIFLVLLPLLGILDQTSGHYIPHYRNVASTYASDAQFVAAIKTAVPRDAMIFQLPYVPFPEYPPPHRMMHYDHLRAYLHSQDLRWSYGAIRGREGDRWQKAVASLSPTELVNTLTFAGFSGIYVDRFGYPDDGASLEQALRQIIGEPPIISANQRLVFFSLTGFGIRLRQSVSPEVWQARQQLALSFDG